MLGIDNDLIEIRKTGKIRVLPFFKRINPYYPVLVRPIVLKKLHLAANKLPEGMYLQVDSGYRTMGTQKALWYAKFARLKAQNPTWLESKITQELQRIVYNPKDGIPPHTTGGAVDVSLTDSSGKEINLSEPHKKYYSEPQLKSHNISERAQGLRQLINKLMIEEGFAPNEREYWHFSYGDVAWAKYYKREPLYTGIEMGRKLEYSFPKKLLYKITRVCWKSYNRIFIIETNY